MLTLKRRYHVSEHLFPTLRDIWLNFENRERYFSECIFKTANRLKSLKIFQEKGKTFDRSDMC